MRNLASELIDADSPQGYQLQEHRAARDVQRLLEAAKGTPYHPIIMLAVHTGLRRGELLGLRWRDVDMIAGTLSVTRIMNHLRDGRTVFQEPKTAKGRRMIALTPASALALRAHLERQEDLFSIKPDSLVFCQVDGSPFLPDSVTHAFHKIARRADLGDVRLHDLRHTHASLMFKAGVHPKIVSERLGHATIGITLDTYSHVTPGLQEAAALRFQEVLSGTPVEAVPQTAG